MAKRGNSRYGKPWSRRGEQKRIRIATEAARIMVEEGVGDFQLAKRKAIARLGIAEERDLPANSEIEAAVAARLQLFHRDTVAHDARRLRRIAVDAMNFLAPFDPRLVGPVLTGTVTPTSDVQLHLCADTPEEIALFLREHGIPFQLGGRRVRYGGERYKDVSTYSFVADGVTVELSVFDPRSVREPPLSPVDGRPIQRGNTRDVTMLLVK
jgi:hypothetical protein